MVLSSVCVVGNSMRLSRPPVDARLLSGRALRN